MDYAYRAPDWLRPKAEPNLKVAAAQPWMGLTAVIREEPWLVIGYDGTNYTLENTQGQTIEVNTPFDWYGATDDDKLIAASRSISREAKLVYDNCWRLAAIPASYEREILWLIDKQGNIHFDDKDQAHNHFDLAAKVLPHDVVTASDESGEPVGWAGSIRDGIIILNGEFPRLADSYSIPDPSQQIANSALAKRVYEAAVSKGMTVEPTYELRYVDPDAQQIVRSVNPVSHIATASIDTVLGSGRALHNITSMALHAQGIHLSVQLPNGQIIELPSQGFGWKENGEVLALASELGIDPAELPITVTAADEQQLQIGLEILQSGGFSALSHDVGERKDEKNDPLVCPDCGSHTVQLTERAFAGDQSEFHCRACGKIFNHKVYFNPHAHVVRHMDEIPESFDFGIYALGYEVDNEGDYHNYAPGPDDAKKKPCPNCGGYKWEDHHKFQLTCAHCKSTYPLEEILHEEKGTMSHVAAEGRCVMCGHPDVRLGQSCPSCGKSQTIWRYDRQPIETVGPQGDTIHAPAANKWAKEAFTKDQNGNLLQVGKPYVMHSPKYKVPDVIRILKVEPNVVEAAIDGDDDAKFPLIINEDEYNKMMYSFEPFDPRPSKQADYGFNPGQGLDDHPEFNKDPQHDWAGPQGMEPGDPDYIIETPWPQIEPLTVPEEFPPLPEEIPVEDPTRPLEPALPGGRKPLPAGGNPPGNPAGHPPLTFPQEWLGQPDPAQAYPRNADEMWNQGSSLWKEALIDPEMNASDIMHQQHMHEEDSLMPKFDDALNIYSVRGTLHLYQNMGNNSQYLVMADGEGGIMGWTPFTGQAMAGQVQQWNTNDLTRIEDSINQGMLMEVPMPALQGPGMGIQPGMMPAQPGIPPNQPGMEMPPPPGGAPGGPDDMGGAPPPGGPEDTSGAPPMPPPPMSHVARKNYSPSEQKVLIEENLKGKARNFDKLNLSGTHYDKKTGIDLDNLDDIDSHLWMW